MQNSVEICVLLLGKAAAGTLSSLGLQFTFGAWGFTLRIVRPPKSPCVQQFIMLLRDKFDSLASCANMQERPWASLLGLDDTRQLPGHKIFLRYPLLWPQETAFIQPPGSSLSSNGQIQTVLNQGREEIWDQGETVKSSLGAGSWFPITRYTQQYLWAILEILKLPPGGRS